MRLASRTLLVAFGAMAFELTGCAALQRLARNSTDEAVAVIEAAIRQINNNAGNLAGALETAQANLTRDAQGVIRNEIANLSLTVVHAAGIEARCTTGFLVDTVLQALLRIKDDLEAGGDGSPQGPPVVCNTVPGHIETEMVNTNRQKVVDVYGYYLKPQATTAELVLEDGRRTPIDQFVQHPSTGHLTIDLGATGVQLGPSSRAIVLSSNGEPISSISVVHPRLARCERRHVMHIPAPIEFLPPRTRGDEDFFGHGPVVDASVKIRANGPDVFADLSMSAREFVAWRQADPFPPYAIRDLQTEGDGTRAEGASSRVVYVAPTGFVVTKVAGLLESTYSYADTDWESDLAYPGQGPVEHFDFIGDVHGPDAGTATKMIVHFNALVIDLEQMEGCLTERIADSQADAAGLSTSGSPG